MEVGRLGLFNISQELKLLEQLANDTSESGVPLRNDYKNVPLSGSLYNIRQGYSCDVASSIPQPLLNATSRASYAETMDDYLTKINDRIASGRNGRWALNDKIQAFLPHVNSVNNAPPPYSQEALGVLRALTHEYNESYQFLSNLQKEVAGSIKVEIESLNRGIGRLSEQYASMKRSDHSERALMMGKYYDGFLALSKSVGVDVPLSGIEEGDIPAQVNIRALGQNLLSDVVKNRSSLSVEILASDPSMQDAVKIFSEKTPISLAGSKGRPNEMVDGLIYGKFASPDQGRVSLEGKSFLKMSGSYTQEEGKLSALLNLYTEVIPAQQTRLQETAAILKDLVPDLHVLSSEESKKRERVFEDVVQANQPQSANVADMAALNLLKTKFTDQCNESLEKISALKNSTIEKKNQSRDTLKLAKSERDSLVRLDKQDYLLKMSGLLEQRDLMLRVLEMMISFNKALARLGSGN